jgi:hypothetical protein
MGEHQRPPQVPKRVYEAEDILRSFVDQLRKPASSSSDLPPIIFFRWMKSHYDRLDGMFFHKGIAPRASVEEQLHRDGLELLGLLIEAEKLRETSLSEKAREQFLLVPREALDLLVAWPMAAFSEAVMATVAAQQEADRLAVGHSQRSRKKDPARVSLLDWVHIQRNSVNEAWKDLMARLKDACAKREVPNPWHNNLPELQKDYSEYLRDRGLGRGKPGRPKKSTPK